MSLTPENSYLSATTTHAVGDSLDITIEVFERVSDSVLTTLIVRSLAESDDCNFPEFQSVTVISPIDTATGSSFGIIPIRM